MNASVYAALRAAGVNAPRVRPQRTLAVLVYSEITQQRAERRSVAVAAAYIKKRSPRLYTGDSPRNVKSLPVMAEYPAPRQQMSAYASPWQPCPATVQIPPSLWSQM